MKRVAALLLLDTLLAPAACTSTSPGASSGHAGEAPSHSTGFPNLRFLEPDGRLKFLFAPGTRHRYSGEGIALLQMVI